MPIVLPKKPLPVARVNPKILIIYSQPKAGKTFQIVELEKLINETGAGNLLIVDTEDGAAPYECTRIPALNHNQLVEVRNEIVKEGQANVDAKKTGDAVYPYKWIVLDTFSTAEEFAWTAATAEYKKTTVGKNFAEKSVITLDHGLGYFYHREKVKEYILDYAASCKYLILVCHLADSEVNKDSIMVTSKAVALTGKLKQIVPGMVDAIGYLYRDKAGKPFINFQTVEGSGMGARSPHLAGQKFEMDWRKIYLDEFDKQPATEVKQKEEATA